MEEIDWNNKIFGSLEEFIERLTINRMKIDREFNFYFFLSKSPDEVLNWKK